LVASLTDTQKWWGLLIFKNSTTIIARVVTGQNACGTLAALAFRFSHSMHVAFEKGEACSAGVLADFPVGHFH
jgi:hypothetical protein